VVEWLRFTIFLKTGDTTAYAPLMPPRQKSKTAAASLLACSHPPPAPPLENIGHTAGPYMLSEQPPVTRPPRGRARSRSSPLSLQNPTTPGVFGRGSSIPRAGGASDPNIEICSLFHAQSPDTGRGVHARSWRANRDVEVSWILFEGTLAGSFNRWPLRGR